MIRPEDIAKLRSNREEQLLAYKLNNREIDHQPVVRLTIPMTGCVWLLSELDEDDLAFGLADLGQGFPELGYVLLSELQEVNVRGLRVVQDETWRADKTLTQYAALAHREQRIVS